MAGRNVEAALEIARRAVAACDAERLTDRALAGAELGDARRIFGVATGKAAPGMQAAVVRVAGERWAGGIVVSAADAGHPLPDERSAAAGRAIESFLAEARLTADDLVVASVSGGTSSLVFLPADGVTLDAVRSRTDELLRSGLDIAELNAERARRSRFHGGGLVELAAPARVVGVILSDVVSGDPSVVGSGPTRGAESVVVAEPRDLALAALEAARALGVEAQLRADALTGEAREAAPRLAGDLPERGLVVGWGEVTVTVRGSGHGGRCQELAWAAAPALDGLDAAVVAVASDGRDYTAGAAGAWVDGTTIARVRAARIDHERVLADNDTGTAHAALGQLIPAWETGTNLSDLYLGVARV